MRFFLKALCLACVIALPVSAGLRYGGSFFTADLAGKRGLTDPSALCVSPDNRHVYIAVSGDDALTFFAVDSATGALVKPCTTAVDSSGSYDSYIQNIFIDGRDGLNGLNGASGIAMSPDGRNVYVAGFDDNAVACFSRDTLHGSLTQIQVMVNNAGLVRGLSGACDVAVSPDGGRVYAVGARSSTLAVFTRDLLTGTLTFERMAKDDSASVVGLDFPISLCIAPDGLTIYTASFGDSGVGVFGSPASFLQIMQRSLCGDTCPVVGINCVRVSPDNRQVYAVSGDDNAITVFTRDAQGLLSLVATRPDTMAEDSLVLSPIVRDGAHGVDGLRGASSCALLPDGSGMVVAGTLDNALVFFSRDSVDGLLRTDSAVVVADGTGGIDGLGGGCAVAVGPDGRTVYAAAAGDDAVSWFVFSDSTAVEAAPGASGESEMLSIAPNPFNPTTVITLNNYEFQISNYELRIYTISGKLVKDLTSDIRYSIFDIHSPRIAAGEAGNSITWDASSCPAGVYLVRAVVGDRVAVKKAVLIK